MKTPAYVIQGLLVSRPDAEAIQRALPRESVADGRGGLDNSRHGFDEGHQRCRLSGLLHPAPLMTVLLATRRASHFSFFTRPMMASTLKMRRRCEYEQVPRSVARIEANCRYPTCIVDSLPNEHVQELIVGFDADDQVVQFVHYSLRVPNHGMRSVLLRAVSNDLATVVDRVGST